MSCCGAMAVIMAERTPFGLKLAALRAERGMQLKQLAERLNVTPAYLSALETGARGLPNRRFLHQICQIFAIIWDEAEALEALARASNPQPAIDVRGKPAALVHLANDLARLVPALSAEEAEEWRRWLQKSSDEST